MPSEIRESMAGVRRRRIAGVRHVKKRVMTNYKMKSIERQRSLSCGSLSSIRRRIVMVIVSVEGEKCVVGTVWRHDKIDARKKQAIGVVGLVTVGSTGRAKGCRNGVRSLSAVADGNRGWRCRGEKREESVGRGK
jgi:hypothetical protein